MIVARPAGFWIRALAALLDFVVFAVVLSRSGSWAPGWGAELESDASFQPLVVFFTLVFAGAYTSVLHHLAGQTIGKMLVGVRVVAADGRAAAVRHGAPALHRVFRLGRHVHARLRDGRPSPGQARAPRPDRRDARRALRRRPMEAAAPPPPADSSAGRRGRRRDPDGAALDPKPAHRDHPGRAGQSRRASRSSSRSASGRAAAGLARARRSRVPRAGAGARGERRRGARRRARPPASGRAPTSSMRRRRSSTPISTSRSTSCSSPPGATRRAPSERRCRA